ncbi:YggS family pyridoxal phosphate-dependent enzyme [bacterium]|nr:YggS family pyridoxal phosphate-dependent enzyme [bacterium]
MITTTCDTIHANWHAIHDMIHQLAPPQRVSVMAVTKYVGPDEIRWLCQAGATMMGENRVQDAQKKFEDPQLVPLLPGIQKHLIGPLQRNKIPQALALFDCIHAIDRWSLLAALQAHLERSDRVITGYIQLNAGREPQKHGFLAEELLASHPKIWSFPNVQIIGIIAVTPFSEVPDANRSYFREAFSIWQTIRSAHSQCTQLSMGMSHDFMVAIQEGATVVRLGSRLYSQPVEEVS